MYYDIKYDSFPTGDIIPVDINYLISNDNNINRNIVKILLT